VIAVAAAMPSAATRASSHWRASVGATSAAPRANADVAEHASSFADAGPELLLLDRCAAQIAAEAGAGAVVHAIAAPRQALVLRDAIEASVPRRDDHRRRDLVYLPRHAVALLDGDELLALLRGLAARHGPDALLVVAVESERDFSRAESTTRARGCGVPVVEHLARVAGWEMCQLWSDGTARHALVVCERACAGGQGELIRVTPVRVST
jgi:hypothetical protein